MSSLVAITAGFASGVFLRSLVVFGWQPIVFALLLASLFGLAAFLKPRLLYSVGAAFCLCVALGMWRADSADTPLPQTFAHDLHHKVSYTGTVISDPDVRDANQRFEVRVTRADDSTNILVVAPRTTDVSVGDTISMTGVLTVPEPFADDGGRMFQYDKYLERDGVRFMMNFALVRVLTGAPWYSIPAALAHVKHAFLDGLARSLPEPYASLAGGIVIGGKSGLGNDLKDVFVRSGLIQIIVLSGYNIMVVAEWLMAALALTPLPRRWSAGAGAVAILIFIGIAGFSATAIRAALMAFIALYARATGRTYAAGRALLAAIFLMLLWNPLYLVYDPGFGLSVTATAGLIWLSPILEGMFSGMKNLFWQNAVATTLAAQIAVLPLLLYDTGNLSLVAIPANLITMPVVPIAMGLSALAGIAGMLFGGLAPVIGIALGYPAYLANAYLIYVAQKAAELPFAAFILPLFPFWLVAAAYAALAAIASSKRFSTTVQLTFAKKASI
jgi:competence protein ComEC